MFIDRAKITVKAGSGGNGMSSFRREKYVPKGGPNGGDGGRGANVVLIGDANLNTLVDFRYKRIFKADHGGNGQSSNMHGRGAEDLLIKVPPGTLIKDEATGQILGDVTETGQRVVVAKGGRGGRGNARFVNSVHRAPTFAELGEPGEERSLMLELKLLADVGLLGYPSVGKSSILSMVSAAKPEIAAYHFTTLSPVLGVVSIAEGQNFVLADIPGLIEGAHEGVGLGHDFLRHIERTKVLIHVLDVSGIEGRDPIEDFHKINNELTLYNEKLFKRPQIIAANKMDLPEAQENYQRVAAYMTGLGHEIYPVSAATGDGLTALMQRAAQLLAEYVEEPEEIAEAKVYEAKATEDYSIRRDDDGAFVVEGAGIEKLVAMTRFNDEEGLRRFQAIWRRLEIDEALRERGIQEGDTVRIRDMEFEFKP
ncbi:GTPase ObgE [Sporomusa acidovorans]|uniref:GTPase Obg n=1 Tax=Sporomusa acidovorans (strain ATCC 49682 / DSM 3132 / Mol) TaxID=1123286 RepID=A0ABZ3J126_SPOA4|nr:GTPase ObgE [Sporomusa acidovorans]OZC22524.1 GTPase Obg [Sporomusa acidovorans DSM 3132]SDE72984.1 GTP-binding protein [Sporomusa acidovorans]